MTWKYTPTPKEREAYLFDGPYFITHNVNEQISTADIQSAILKVIQASFDQDGLDKVQRLVHQESGNILWIIDNLSEHHKDQILEMSPTPENDLRESDATTVLFPEDY